MNVFDYMTSMYIFAFWFSVSNQTYYRNSDVVGYVVLYFIVLLCNVSLLLFNCHLLHYALR